MGSFTQSHSLPRGMHFALRQTSRSGTHAPLITGGRTPHRHPSVLPGGPVPPRNAQLGKPHWPLEVEKLLDTDMCIL